MLLLLILVTAIVLLLCGGGGYYVGRPTYSGRCAGYHSLLYIAGVVIAVLLVIILMGDK